MTNQRTCCGSVSLRTASIVIAIFDILLSIIDAFQARSSVRFVAFVVFVSSVLLIVGALRKNLQWMWPWTLLNIFALVILVNGGVNFVYTAYQSGLSTSMELSVFGYIVTSNTTGISEAFHCLVFGFRAFWVYIVCPNMMGLRAESKPDEPQTIEYMKSIYQ